MAVAITATVYGGRKRTKRRVIWGSMILVMLTCSFPTALEEVRPFGARGADGVVQWRAALSVGDVSSGFTDAEKPEPAGEDFCQSSFYAKGFCASIRFLPQAILRPFWWEISNEPVWLLAGSSTAHFLFLTAMSVVHLARKRNRTLGQAGLVGLALLNLLIISGILSNYGILIRFRIASEIFLMPSATAGLICLTKNTSDKIVNISKYRAK
jgi:hypothetical protein